MEEVFIWSEIERLRTPVCSEQKVTSNRFSGYSAGMEVRMTEYICADQPVTPIFRSRQGGGPYILNGETPLANIGNASEASLE